MTDTTDSPKQVPLIELLQGVPADARLVYDDGPYSTRHIPVGRYCQEAAALLADRASRAPAFTHDDADRLFGRPGDADCQVAYGNAKSEETMILAQHVEQMKQAAQDLADRLAAAPSGSRAPAQDLYAEIERLRAGLQWYADGEHYVLDGWDEPDEPGWLCPDEGDHPWMVESGNTARLILKGAVMVNDGETICAMPLAAAPSAQAMGEGANKRGPSSRSRRPGSRAR